MATVTTTTTIIPDYIAYICNNKPCAISGDSNPNPHEGPDDMSYEDGELIVPLMPESASKYGYYVEVSILPSGSIPEICRPTVFYWAYYHDRLFMQARNMLITYTNPELCAWENTTILGQYLGNILIAYPASGVGSILQEKDFIFRGEGQFTTNTIQQLLLPGEALYMFWKFRNRPQMLPAKMCYVYTACLTSGVILSVNEEYGNEYITYNVQIEGRQYADLIPSDFHQYQVGDIVVVAKPGWMCEATYRENSDDCKGMSYWEWAKKQEIPAEEAQYEAEHAGEEGKLEPITQYENAGYILPLKIGGFVNEVGPSSDPTIDYSLPYDFNRIHNISIVEGTIVEVDYERDEAKITINDEEGNPQTYEEVPIYYDCHDSDTFERGSSAFYEGDEVYVMIEGGLDKSVFTMKIIGFTDGVLHQCEDVIYMHILRDDGKVAGAEVYADITVYNSKKEQVLFIWYGPAETEEFKDYYVDDPSSTYYQYFKLRIPHENKDPNGYWVKYELTDSVPTQYPYEYHEDDMWEAGDLLLPDSYRTYAPYWKRVFVKSSIDSTLLLGQTDNVELKVYSSIPYKVTRMTSHVENSLYAVYYRASYFLQTYEIVCLDHAPPLESIISIATFPDRCRLSSPPTISEIGTAKVRIFGGTFDFTTEETGVGELKHEEEIGTGVIAGTSHMFSITNLCDASFLYYTCPSEIPAEPDPCPYGVWYPTSIIHDIITGDIIATHSWLNTGSKYFLTIFAEIT
jgi:hypothetical protein